MLHTATTQPRKVYTLHGRSTSGVIGCNLYPSPMPCKGGCLETSPRQCDTLWTASHRVFASTTSEARFGHAGETWDRHTEVISAYLEGERANRRIIGPVPSSPGSVQVSSRVIPKRHQPGKWRLILDLSSTCGGSVNDKIYCEWCSSHVSVILCL